MDPIIWRRLPDDLVHRVADFLDPATRRDIGLGPRRLVDVPDLDLHFGEIKRDAWGRPRLRLNSFELTWTDSYTCFKKGHKAAYTMRDPNVTVVAPKWMLSD